VTESDAKAPPDPVSEGEGDPPAPAVAGTTVTDPDPTGDPLFDALWAKVLVSWDDDKVHGAILEYSVGNERLPDLAGHYRALKDDAAKAERAKKRLDAIILAATQMMMSMKSSGPTKVPVPITLSVVGLALFALAFVAYAMLHR
jgi:hypothetical protein